MNKTYFDCNPQKVVRGNIYFKKGNHNKRNEEDSN